MGYSNDPYSVRVLFFGKDGHFTRACSVPFPTLPAADATESELRRVFGRALRIFFQTPAGQSLAEAIAVCPDPPHPHEGRSLMLACFKLSSTVL